MDQQQVVYERNKLYQEVWAEPIREVAKRYGVSDVGLAKTCRRLGVPLPGRGHWAKLRAGKEVPPQPALPSLPQGVYERIVTYHREPPAKPAMLRGLENAVPVQIPQPIVVSEVRENPHRLVKLSARYLQRAHPREDGLLSARRSSCLDICVSPTSLDRALRIADALLRALEAADLPVEIAPLEESPQQRPSYYGRLEEPPRPPLRITRVRCDDEWINFSLTERARRSVDPGPASSKGQGASWGRRVYAYEATGELSLNVTNAEGLGLHTSWKDGKRQRLEECLEEFVAYLSTVALAFKLKREEEARQAQAAHEKAVRDYEEYMRRFEEEKRQRQEEERGKKLEARVARWRRAQDIRDYIKVASRRLDSEDPISEDVQRQRNELAWALRWADRIDPLVPRPDEPPAGS
jgi:hypothetical protein